MTDSAGIDLGIKGVGGADGVSLTGSGIDWGIEGEVGAALPGSGSTGTDRGMVGVGAVLRDVVDLPRPDKASNASIDDRTDGATERVTEGVGEAVLEAAGEALADDISRSFTEAFIDGATEGAIDCVTEGVGDTARETTGVALGVGFAGVGAGSSGIDSDLHKIGIGSQCRSVSPTSVRSNIDLTSSEPLKRLSNGFGDCSILLV